MCVCVCVFLRYLSDMQTASGLCHIILSVACPTLQYFSTLSHKRRDFCKKTLLNIKCVLWFSLRLLSETFLILRRIRQHIFINVHRSSCKVPVSLVTFYWNLILMERLSKNPQISNFVKIRPLRTELFRPDEHYEANSRFTQFVERSLKKKLLMICAMDYHVNVTLFLSQEGPVSRK